MDLLAIVIKIDQTCAEAKNVIGVIIPFDKPILEKTA